MNQVPEETPRQARHLLPRRQCAGCSAYHDVLHLTHVAHDWYCPPCYHRIVRRDHSQQTSASFPTHDALRPLADADEVQQNLQRLDTTCRFGATAIKILIYGALYALSRQHEFMLHALAGFFVADLAAWVLTSWFDLRFHRTAVIVECVLYTTAAIVLQYSGIFHIPEEPSDLAIMGMAFSAAFACRMLRYGLTWLRGD